MPDLEKEHINWKRKLISIGKKSANALFLSLCKPLNSRMVTVNAVSLAVSNDYYRNAMVGSSGMLLKTENFLNGNLLRKNLSGKPQLVVQKILEFYQISRDIEYWAIAADVCRYIGRRKTGLPAVQFYLSAYYYSYVFLKKYKETGKDFAFSSRDFCYVHIVHIYNEAIGGIFRYLKTQHLLGSQASRLETIDGRKFEFEKPAFNLSVPPKAVTEFSLCSDYDVRGLLLNNRHFGCGVPLVAKIAKQPFSKSLKTPDGLTIPVTLVLKACELPDGTMSLLPFFQDTSIRETISIEAGRLMQGEWGLARDFTTPFACFLHAIGQRNLLTAMLQPETHSGTSGLFMIEPYQPDKIPVIFVHGLLSSPETWGDMVNSLKASAEIRRRYQFWFFSYSTGMPLLASAQALRLALREARQEFCTTPETTANFEKMVLVGHSMGGMIVRLLLQQDPAFLVEAICRMPLAELRKKLSAVEMKAVEDLVIQIPLDFVHRAVFMAAPHRGAAMAKQKIAKIGINLTQIPESMLAQGRILLQIYRKLFPDAKKTIDLHAFSGIGNLAPDSPIVSVLGDSPLKKDVVFHSIIGNKDAAGVPGGSDGIVPYSSSHVEAAKSECIVRSGHSVHQTPAAILELLRILLVHLNGE